MRRSTTSSSSACAMELSSTLSHFLRPEVEEEADAGSVDGTADDSPERKVDPEEEEEDEESTEGDGEGAGAEAGVVMIC